MLDSAVSRNATKIIYNALTTGEKLTNDNIDCAQIISADFNQVGIMVKRSLLPKNIAFEM